MALRDTPLTPLHEQLGARMGPFAGWNMPIQYPAGVMAEHLACRAGAGLFDVSHMGQVLLHPLSGGVAEAAAALEKLVPVDVAGLPAGRQRYAMFTTEAGGILDDLMVANRGDHLFLVLNAANAAAGIAHLGQLRGITVEPVTDRALLALQGPAAECALNALVPGVAEMRFMDAATLDSPFGALWITRSGYTGDDGYEISVPADQAVGLARALLTVDGVVPVGLGARDSLRLEAGLPLHGQDITEATDPVAADLGWAIQNVRRTGGARAGGFPGAGPILAALAEGPSRRRVGLSPEGRAPMRAGTPLFSTETATAPVGEVTSGGFGPSVGAPISMGYVTADLTAPGTGLYGEVRGKRLPVTVVPLPFRPATYKR
jgi:aminomethyltransferase